MFANVMIPAFGAPYFAPIFLPLSILVTLLAEFVVWKAIHWKIPSGSILWWIFWSNVLSTIVGIFISPLLFVPFGWEEGRRELPVPSPEYGWLIYVAMIQACVLSMVIEYLAFVPFRRKWCISQLELSVVLGNVASYIGLAATILLVPNNIFKSLSGN